ncbi:YheT family hydrolase [Chitinilyticum piscinae]|nr:alpha/beta fold hydrolase [Chitinilyticum piscinae]
MFWRRSNAWRREGWITPDLDAVAVDWADGRVGKPVVVIFHGLEGGSRSHYAESIAERVVRQGWHAVVPHFRTCGNVPNRLSRAYHAGDSAEIGWMLERVRLMHPDSSLFAVGISLGGNALLKWLGEQGGRAQDLLQAAAAVSAPADLAACGAALDQGANRYLYTREFLRTLKSKTLASLKLNNNPFIDIEKVRRVSTLRDFDDLVTAPLHGFHGVEHYWRVASSKPVLRQIVLPTMMINARNDPFIPPGSLPGADDVSEAVLLLQPEEGGHAGFVSGWMPGQLSWLPDVLMRFFNFHSPR